MESWVGGGAAINLLRTFHYQGIVLVGCHRMVMHAVEAVLATGAGPNLVRDSMLPSDWRWYASSSAKLPRVRDANNRRLNVEGVISVAIRVLGHRGMRGTG